MYCICFMNKRSNLINYYKFEINFTQKRIMWLRDVIVDVEYIFTILF